MATNLAIDDKLLEEYIRQHKRLQILEQAGTIDDDDLDSREARRVLNCVKVEEQSHVSKETQR